MTAPLTWTPPLDVALVVALVALVIGCAALSVRRSSRAGPWLIALRSVAALTIGAALLGPSVRTVLPGAEKPSVTVLVDTSRSMERAMDAVRRAWLAPEVIERLARSADARVLAFDERPRTVITADAAALEARGASSRVAAALDAALSALHPARDEPDSGAMAGARHTLLISDLIDTSGADVVAVAAKAPGGRVHVALPAAPEQAERADLAIRARVRTALAPAGEAIPVDVRLTQRGLEGQPVTVTIRQTAPVVATLAERTLTPRRNDAISLDITPRLAPGAERGVHSVALEASVRALSAEEDVENNTSVFFAQVSDARTRVLLLEGEPSFDARFATMTLAEDPAFDVTTVHFVGRPGSGADSAMTLRTRRIRPGVARTIEQTGAEVSLTDAGLAAFDVVLLGKGIEALLPGEAAAGLARFVERGGALVLLRGDPIRHDEGARAALARTIPLRFSGGATDRRALFATEAGARALAGTAPAIDEAPEVDGVELVEALSPLASVWLSAGDAPAMLHARSGGGQVVVNLAQGMWRWSMLPPAQRGWARALRGLWAHVVRTLALADGGARLGDASLALDPLEARPGEEVTIVLRARGPVAGALTPVVRLALPGQEAPIERALAPSAGAPGLGDKWTGVFRAEREGVATVTLGAERGVGRDLVARMFVRADDEELRDLTPRERDAAALARATGGEVFALDEADRFVELVEREALAAGTREGLEAAWTRWWVFAVIMAALGAEWLWRRSIGLA